MDEKKNLYFDRMTKESGVDPATEKLAEAAIGAAIEVHRHLGPSLPESVYRKALCVELELRGIPYACEVPVPISYKGTDVGKGYIDILVDNLLIIELKAVEALGPLHRAQALAYLAATGRQLALLINFNVVILHDGIKRIIKSK